MDKKMIIKLIIAGLVSFALAFGVFFFLLKKNPEDTNGVDPLTLTDAKEQQDYVDPSAPSENQVSKTRADILTEKQMKSLIIDIKERRKEYDQKEKELEMWEAHLKTAQATLDKDCQRLEDLRLKLVSTMADFKISKKQLDDSILEIQQIEKDNLIWRASVYDKMDAASAATIFIDMVKNKQLDDAAKIIHYMNERNAAKLLAEIANTDPNMATAINAKLKRIKEQSI